MLISIPRSSALVLAPRQKCPCPDFLTPEAWSRQPWFAKLGIMLLHEKRLGPKSRLAAYVEQLPPSYDAPVLWTPAQVEALQHPALIAAVKAQRVEWEGLHAQLQAGLQPGQAPVALDDFLWALCAVRSRTFSGPYIGTSLKDRLLLVGLVAGLAGLSLVLGLADPERTATAALAALLFNVLYEVILSRSLKQYTMAPLLDFINHSATTQSEVSLDYFSDRYSVQAGRAFAQGEQVFISYGSGQTNDSLLQYYGFVEPGTPADKYVLTRGLQWLAALTKVGPARLQRLEAEGLKQDLETVAVAPTGVPGPVLNALRFLLADGARAAKGPSAFDGPGSDEEERAVAEVLVAVLRSELRALGTTLEQDQLLLQGGGAVGGKGGSNARNKLSTHQRLALEFRIEKKKILAACLASLGAEGPA